MNFSVPPGLDDVTAIATQILENLPDELSAPCEDLSLVVEEFPDETLIQDMSLESDYDLLALYRSGKEVAPGVQKKVANSDDTLFVFRRPILDLWCETGDDLGNLVREVVIEEIARAHEFPEEDIRRMIKIIQQTTIL